jgi:N-dimethylarginine dimethylaminohydrolase
MQSNSRRILVCPPDYFTVSYEINPWMKIDRTPVADRARSQWKNFHDALKAAGAQLEYLDPAPRFPDLVFTANGGLIRGKKALLARFRHVERQGEEPLFEAWFKKAGYEVHHVTSGAFEGEGDALFAGETLFCGSGFRSDAQVFPKVQKLLDIRRIRVCTLIDPRYYHLDTCFCPLDAQRALYVPGAFTPESIQMLKQDIELIPLNDHDAQLFGCNSVVLGKEIVLPAECHELEVKLKDLGYSTHPVELGEFLKSGGSAKCLTLFL